MTTGQHPVARSGPPSRPEEAPDEVARTAVDALLDLHLATSVHLQVASLPETARHMEAIALVLTDVVQDLHRYCQHYSLDSGGITTEHTDLRTQARVTGNNAATKYAEALELIHQATRALSQASHDAALMHDLTGPTTATATAAAASDGATLGRPARSASLHDRSKAAPGRPDGRPDDGPDDGPAL